MRERMSSELRPIPARLLKSLVDSTRPWAQGGHVLELFAGTGAYGIACLKEGAESVVFVEKSKERCDAIRKQAGDKAKVHRADAMEFLKTQAALEGTFDVVFADPPFPLWDDEDFSSALFEMTSRFINDSGLLIFKFPTHGLPPSGNYGLRHKKSAKVGDSQLIYFSRQTETDKS